MLDNSNHDLRSSQLQTAAALNVRDDEMEIDLLELFFVLKKKLWLLILVTLIGGCLSGLYTHFLITPIYSSTSSMLVLSKETTLTSLTDLQLGTSLTSDYKVLIKSSPVLEQVIEHLNLDLKVTELKELVFIDNPTGTRILEITVEHPDAAMAKSIVDEIVTIASAYIGDKMEVIPPKIIEVGKIAAERTSPSMAKNVAIGCLLGLFACAALIVLHTIMDDTLQTEEDIEKYLGVSVLAKIPDRKDYVNMKKNKKK